jgi:glycosidase
MKKLIHLLLASLIAGFLLVSCNCNRPDPCTQLTFPEWSINATIYEVNLRQFTAEGTIAAFREHLPRLKDLGVDILWFMPVHPIGLKDRKDGPDCLGSYYSIKDYRAINPEFGTEQEFIDLVKEIHSMGMRVILDLVPNHTARDHPWIAQNPDWYEWADDGTPVGPFDWSDVAQLNWKNPEVWDAMLGDMLYQVRKWNIDGFRCDVAGMVPVEFWERAILELNEVKEVFMLAEDEGYSVFLDRAFHANYAWELSNDIMNGLTQGRRTINDLMTYLEKERRTIVRRGYRMMFTSNHDENSWVGTEFDRMGDAVRVMAVFKFTFENSFPLIYSGQEVGFDKKLRFFQKDTILCDDPHGFTPFYQTLTTLKKNNEALANGEFGGRMVRVNSNEQDKVLAFVREKNGNQVFTVLNLSKGPVNIVLEGCKYVGEYTEIFSGSRQTLSLNHAMTLEPWGYRVFVRN